MGSYAVYGYSDDLSSMPPKRSPSRALFALWEIVPAAASAVITTCYAVQHENAANVGDCKSLTPFSLCLTDFRLKQHGDPADAGFLTIPYTAGSIWTVNPGPGTMLGACLTFGCSISSFSYRRQERDRYQTVFFVVAICVACASGAISGHDPNLIMLGYIPWALCLAILTSAFFHWMLRQCGMKTGHVKNDLEDNKEAW